MNLTGAIFSPRTIIRNQLEEGLGRVTAFTLIRSLDRYLSGGDLIRFLRTQAPTILFVDFAALHEATTLVAEAEMVIPGIQIVALHEEAEPELLLSVMRAGVREFLSVPLIEEKLLQALARAVRALEVRPAKAENLGEIRCFFPAKPGGGASTLAVNMSEALARLSGKRVLLADFDLTQGMTTFLLKLSNNHSVMDALQHAGKLDESLWPNLVTSRGNLDILGSGRFDPQYQVNLEELQRLIQFFRSYYDIICVDLPGNWDQLSLELLRESRQIYLVCTPEIPSLHLARTKADMLRSLELADRVSVLLNRVHKRSGISMDDVRRLVGLPVQWCFPNDYRRVNVAMEKGSYVDPSSELGKQLDLLARGISGMTAPPAPAPASLVARRFVDYFSVTPDDALSNGKDRSCGGAGRSRTAE